MCGKIEDFEFNLESTSAHAEKISGYKVEKTELVFNGVCPSCQDEA